MTVSYGACAVLCALSIVTARQAPLPLADEDRQTSCIQVVFRCDDFSSQSDLKAEQRVVAIFEAHSRPVTLAVVPFAGGTALEGERAELLRQWVSAGVVEPAVHGYSHTNVLVSGGSKSEFVGRALEEQAELLQLGKDHLESVLGGNVAVFVPPWNSYDNLTLEAAYSVGFSVLSAANGQPCKDGLPLRHVPFGCTLHEYKEAVARARRLRRSGEVPIVVVLMHASEFAERDPVGVGMGLFPQAGAYSYSELSAALEWTRSQPDLTVCTLEEAADAVPSTAADAYCLQMSRLRGWLDATSSASSVRRRLLPPPLALRGSRDPSGYSLAYPATPYGRFSVGFSLVDVLWPLIALHYALAAVGVGCGAAAGRLLLWPPKARRPERLELATALMPAALRIAAVAAFVLLVSAVFACSVSIGYAKAIAFTSMSGVCVGLLASRWMGTRLCRRHPDFL